MKKIGKLGITGLAVLAFLAVSGTALAASQYKTPVEALAGLTGRDVQSIIDERLQTGKSYGLMADDAGKLSEFEQEIWEIQKDTLAARVADGTITQEQADAIIASDKNQSYCAGRGSGWGLGNGFGYMGGSGMGYGRGGCGGGLFNR
jgi:hypothetical protein